MTRLLHKVILVLLSSVIFFSTQFGIVYAEGVEQLGLPQTGINPGSFYYPVKRLWEKGRARFLFSIQSKVDFHESLLKIRLAELKYVVERKLLSEMQTSSERFAYQAGILTEEIIGQKDEDRQQTIEVFKRYSDYLAELRDKYAANTSFWMLIQHDINSLNILSERLK